MAKHVKPKMKPLGHSFSKARKFLVDSNRVARMTELLKPMAFSEGALEKATKLVKTLKPKPTTKGLFTVSHVFKGRKKVLGGFSTKSSYKGKKKALINNVRFASTPKGKKLLKRILRPTPRMTGVLPTEFIPTPIFLNELRKKYGKGLKPHKQLEIEDMIRRFAELAYAKYAAGAKEHKDDLTVEVAKKELGQEGLDMIIYLFKAGLL